MNTDQIKGSWKQFAGKAKETWGRLTDDDWKVVEGRRDQLVGKIQERYGIAREEAERQVSESRGTADIEHLGPGAEPEPLAVLFTTTLFRGSVRARYSQWPTLSPEPWRTT